MLYIHDSVKTGKFIQDKKLNLLKHGVITINQFVQLIDINDPYTLIGPAIVSKDKINQFIQEWQSSITNIKTIDEAFEEEINPELILNNLDRLNELFPEITQTVSELKIKLKTANCPVCQRNKYLIIILNDIKAYYKDGRNLFEMKDFIESALAKYFPYYKQNLLNNQQDFDIVWVKPDTLIGLGRDLINRINKLF